jgi:acyl carrier protein
METERAVGTGTLPEVIAVVVSVLGIEDRRSGFSASSGLFGSIPELDSMAVVDLVLALQDRFGIEIDDDEITGESFETLGDLAALVDAKLR